MNEHEWLACAAASEMLHYLEHFHSSPVSERKLRLFACACCRRIGDHFPDEGHRRAVEVAERFADGLASLSDLEEARRPVWQCIQRATVQGVTHAASWAVLRAAGEVRVRDYWAGVAADALGAVKARRTEQEAQAALLRDIVGNPFRPALVDPPWLTWNRGAVPQMARIIYEERRFEEMPCLGDALEDAGCTDSALLAHCRGSREHVRGCWVVDLLTGRE
ncbi:MAG: hypothetical protein L0Z62_22535 [Gemmataceae bacterium]|nr:hypothetical protein [Gemmataceae bacterium]